MRILTLIISGLLLLAPVASADAAPPFTLFPVVGGAHYVDDFGQARPGGSHEGNDLLAPCGTPVIAVVPGTVTLDYGSRSGWMVTLKGASSWYRYIHMDGRQGEASAFAKGLKDGSRVKAGQIISYVGNTGDAAGGPCHLHFEYHKGDGVSSPFAFLEQAVIVQLDPANPLSANTSTPQVSLTITGVIAWAALASGQGRMIVRPLGVSTSDGTRVGHAGTIALRADPALLATASIGRRVTITTVPAQMTTALQDIAPYAWTAAAIS